MDPAKPQNAAEAMFWTPCPGEVAEAPADRRSAPRVETAALGVLTLAAGIVATWWGFADTHPKLIFNGVLGLVCGPFLILRALFGATSDDT